MRSFVVLRKRTRAPEFTARGRALCPLHFPSAVRFPSTRITCTGIWSRCVTRARVCITQRQHSAFFLCVDALVLPAFVFSRNSTSVVKASDRPSSSADHDVTHIFQVSRSSYSRNCSDVEPASISTLASIAIIQAFHSSLCTSSAARSSNCTLIGARLCICTTIGAQSSIRSASRARWVFQCSQRKFEILYCAFGFFLVTQFAFLLAFVFRAIAVRRGMGLSYRRTQMYATMLQYIRCALDLLHVV